MSTKSDLDTVLRNLNDAITRTQSGTNAGLRAVAVMIERAAKKRAPREYGNLIGSGYHSKRDEGTYEIGFTAKYAPYVHENLEEKLKGKKRKSGVGVYWGPKGESRFLAKGIEEVTPKVPDTMLRYAQKELLKGKRR